jgi:hypothetical protein
VDLPISRASHQFRIRFKCYGALVRLPPWRVGEARMVTMPDGRLINAVYRLSFSYCCRDSWESFKTLADSVPRHGNASSAFAGHCSASALSSSAARSRHWAWISASTAGSMISAPICSVRVLAGFPAGRDPSKFSSQDRLRSVRSTISAARRW